MKERFRLSEFRKAISLGQVISYLGSNGWTIHPGEKPIRCEGPQDDAGLPIVAFIPSDDTLRDYPLRLEDLVILLSELEERPALAVANDMSSIQLHDESARPTRIAFVDILKKHTRGMQSERIAEQCARMLDVLAENAELSLGGGKSIAVASLLNRCAKMQGSFEEPRLLLWRLAEWAGISLKDVTPEKLDTMFQLAVSSSDESETLFEWLNANRTEDSDVADQLNELEALRQSDSTDQ